jgi:hypothetical protein
MPAQNAENDDITYDTVRSGDRLEPIRTCPLDTELHDLDQRASRAALSRTQSLEHRVSLPREILVVGCICLAMFTTQVGLGITIDLLHVIGDHFGVKNPGILSWLIAGCKCWF